MKTMKGLILAGLMSTIALMGTAESAKALPVSVPCSVSLTEQGQQRVNPYSGDCAVDIANGIVTVRVTVRFQDGFTIVWGDTQDSVLTSTTMGLFRDGRNGLVLSSAMTKTEQGVTCAAGSMGTRMERILTACFSRTTYDGLSELSQNAQ
jgi:hypothetical protein